MQIVQAPQTKRREGLAGDTNRQIKGHRKGLCFESGWVEKARRRKYEAQIIKGTVVYSHPNTRKRPSALTKHPPSVFLVPHCRLRPWYSDDGRRRRRCGRRACQTTQ
jgi:hypothetical protein